MTDKFEIGEIVEMVRGKKEDDYTASVIRRFISDEEAIKELVDLNPARDGDLVKVHERRLKKDGRGVEHDLYLCQNLRTEEFSLFGRSGLRKQVDKGSR